MKRKRKSTTTLNQTTDKKQKTNYQSLLQSLAAPQSPTTTTTNTSSKPQTSNRLFRKKTVEATTLTSASTHTPQKLSLASYLHKPSKVIVSTSSSSSSSSSLSANKPLIRHDFEFDSGLNDLSGFQLFNLFSSLTLSVYHDQPPIELLTYTPFNCSKTPFDLAMRYVALDSVECSPIAWKRFDEAFEHCWYLAKQQNALYYVLERHFKLLLNATGCIISTRSRKLLAKLVEENIEFVMPEDENNLVSKCRSDELPLSKDLQACLANNIPVAITNDGLAEYQRLSEKTFKQSRNAVVIKFSNHPKNTLKVLVAWMKDSCAKHTPMICGDQMFYQGTLRHHDIEHETFQKKTGSTCYRFHVPSKKTAPVMPPLVRALFAQMQHNAQTHQETVLIKCTSINDTQQFNLSNQSQFPRSCVEKVLFYGNNDKCVFQVK